MNLIEVYVLVHLVAIIIMLLSAYGLLRWIDKKTKLKMEGYE